ncbi:Asp-tRNA(Asn)/Glu-tRNA(Gln) amidotransferase subunit GatB [bacterium]|jgi:aspartyl-tRNA(Asn)/glutamyl-tRNA(Gln) amidotransferase subunit B|nr:Asp-tRNA(Asn)/Glu-tRNA(Gln) amidotransferase subunit GatB [bacterium]MBT4251216.1 Asp-tRNA(Asn)/Glu-tRNA(Gln) amidotransferase subunit GatB [bacterium]MBT4597992.1 Asp-tRNA(Asn)/Glu-tRNA(Gln) amidotransferase subunit GatB [bacterium]MBT6753595.1 Asp-tRNA(Asn)/Glu-tRNA(Gln) amidotransferase subunit GatB [bacterium]MBT7037710.1 Asp-tRNA(Asn)/Glu-tRNA(Gln) amidotransferase subunit GatB [bacterium]
MGKYRPTIGMEVHVELATKSKMFCGCKNGMGQEKSPNKNICPVCTGQPGAIPVPNAQAIEFTIQAGLALDCHIAKESKFDRKNYFYPDLPKGYQISQFDKPICSRGSLKFTLKSDDGTVVGTEKVGITRIHLEEDTGKLVHEGKNTLVDFNRACVPLMELVTDPDINSAAEAKRFCEDLRLLFRYLGISPADMEKGQMRCEANISLYEVGKDPLSGTKVELKNLNSFRAVERGIEYEIERQTEVLTSGGVVHQETRGWDEKKGRTFLQRSKEDAHDYRYFPEPDIAPFKLEESYVELLREKLPELPTEKRNRFVEQFGLKLENASILVVNKELAEYFENVASELENWMKEEGHSFNEEDTKKLFRLAANYILTELSRRISDTEGGMKDFKISAENFAELIKIVYEGEINSSAAQTVLGVMFETGADPSHVVEEKGLAQTSDEGELGDIIEKIITDNSGPTEDYKNGKENAIKFLVGQVMAATKGSANPQVVKKVLMEKLS